MDAQQGRAPAPQWPDVRSDGQGADERPSPWRKVIDEISQKVGGRRDEIATIGSINWLRHAMEGQGANPNVVRNIIYRDKGTLNDKRALYVVLQRLRA